MRLEVDFNITPENVHTVVVMMNPVACCKCGTKPRLENLEGTYNFTLKSLVCECGVRTNRCICRNSLYSNEEALVTLKDVVDNWNDIQESLVKKNE